MYGTIHSSLVKRRENCRGEHRYHSRKQHGNAVHRAFDFAHLERLGRADCVGAVAYHKPLRNRIYDFEFAANSVGGNVAEYARQNYSRNRYRADSSKLVRNAQINRRCYRLGQKRDVLRVVEPENYVSFAQTELLGEKLGVGMGATNVFELLADGRACGRQQRSGEPYNGCSDGTTTGYMKFETRRLADDLIPYTAHEPKFITL